MTAKKLEATVNANKDRREVTVVVEHEDWQSYSRSVQPKAKKEFKRWISENIMFGSLAITDALYLDTTTHEGRSLSVFFFTY